MQSFVRASVKAGSTVFVQECQPLCTLIYQRTPPPFHVFIVHSEAQSATINDLKNTVQQLTQELAELKQRDHSESSIIVEPSPSPQQNIYPDVRPCKKEASPTESSRKFNIVV